MGLPAGTVDGSGNNISADNAQAVRYFDCILVGVKKKVIYVHAVPASTVHVEREQCYGLNTVSWSPAAGDVGSHEVYTSAYSNFSSQLRVYSGLNTNISIIVPGTR